MKKNHTFTNTESHQRRSESSATLYREPQISHLDICLRIQIMQLNFRLCNLHYSVINMQTRADYENNFFFFLDRQITSTCLSAYVQHLRRPVINISELPQI